MPRHPASPSGLLTIRAAFILLLAVLAAGITAGLTWAARRSAAEAALAGFAVLAGSIRFFDWLIS